jgi:AcrR family transcriptional regulator
VRATPPYVHLLKRRPAQARSARRVEAILDAAAELLRDHEPEAVTVRDLAAGANVPTGTLYQFFDDKDAVFQALALRFLAAMPGVLDAALASDTPDWPDTLRCVIDSYAAMLREHPAIRRLWLSGALDAATRHVERETDETLAARLGARLAAQAGTHRGTPEPWRVVVALVDGLLRHAFAEDPNGDPQALSEALRATEAYVAVLLETTTDAAD